MRYGAFETDVTCEIFKVGLTIPTAADHVSYCVGLGLGPSEHLFREWVHKRILLSKIPLLWAQVEPLQWWAGRDVDRQLQLMAYASSCNPQRQVFWTSDEAPSPDAGERFLQAISGGEVPSNQSGCALMLSGWAVGEMNLGRRSAASEPATARPMPRNDGWESVSVAMETHRSPAAWTTLLSDFMSVLRKKLAFLWV